MNNKELFLRALADVIKERRGSVSITQLSLESDVSKSILFMIEKANRDPQLSTFFKIAEALYLKPSELVSLLEKRLGDSFSFIENQ